MIRACHVIDSINADKGGPSVSVPALVEALHEINVKSSVVAINYPRFGSPILPKHAPATLVNQPFLTTPFHYSLGLKRALSAKVSEGVELFHTHGMWLYANCAARDAAKKAKVPLIISPRGMLQKWSLQQKAFKKSLAWRAYGKELVASASLIHVTSQMEYEELLPLRIRRPVAVIPNGIDMPTDLHTGRRVLLETDHSELKGKQILLFISRLHKKKGLDVLLECWKMLAADFPKWHLLIVGKEDGLSIAKLKESAGSSLSSCTFAGSLYGTQREAAFESAEAFVLPSYSENFGIAIGEALSWGLPVLITNTTPWHAVTAKNCGYCIDPSREMLHDALRRMLSLTDQERSWMGTKGREWIQQDFSWKNIARNMNDAYDWILSGSQEERPVCVKLCI